MMIIVAIHWHGTPFYIEREAQYPMLHDFVIITIIRYNISATVMKLEFFVNLFCIDVPKLIKVCIFCQ